MGSDSEMNYSLSEIALLSEEELISKSQAMERAYQIQNKPRPKEVKGVPTWLDIHGESRYCLHYSSKKRKNGPVFIDIHGGGFVWGSPEEDDLFSARLNKLLDIEVYSLEYPRTAVHPFPEALDQLYDTIKFMADHSGDFNFNPMFMAVGGHSAGGNLAAAITLKNNKHKDFNVKCQILAYPCVDFDINKISDEEIAKDGLGLNREIMAFFNRVYVPRTKRKDEFCQPILATVEEMKGLPPAVLLTCGNDILRFQGRAYGAKLMEAYVPVLAREFDGCAHAFEVFQGEHMQEGQDFLINGIKFWLGL
jgi:acetyl esterase